MARVIAERVSSMVEGAHCCVIVNHHVQYFPVHKKESKKYIKLNGKHYHEDELPFGIEVEL